MNKKKKKNVKYKLYFLILLFLNWTVEKFYFRVIKNRKKLQNPIKSQP